MIPIIRTTIPRAAPKVNSRREIFNILSPLYLEQGPMPMPLPSSIRQRELRCKSRGENLKSHDS